MLSADDAQSLSNSRTMSSSGPAGDVSSPANRPLRRVVTEEPVFSPLPRAPGTPAGDEGSEHPGFSVSTTAGGGSSRDYMRDEDEQEVRVPMAATGDSGQVHMGPANTQGYGGVGHTTGDGTTGPGQSPAAAAQAGKGKADKSATAAAGNDKSKYRRARLGPPRASRLYILVSTLMMFVLLAAATVVVGVPPLFMATDKSRRTYIGIMAPVLTVVVTLIHYHITDYPMRRLSVLLLKISKQLELHSTTLEGHIHDARERHAALEEAVGDGGRVSGGSSASQGALQRLHTDDSVAAAADLATTVETVLRDIAAQQKWMERQLKVLEERPKDAIHPEVHSQQRLLRYFLSTVFHSQNLLLTEWAHALAQTLAVSGIRRVTGTGSYRQAALAATPALSGRWPPARSVSQLSQLRPITPPLSAAAASKRTISRSGTPPRGYAAGGGADTLTPLAPVPRMGDLDTTPVSDRADGCGGGGVRLPTFSAVQTPGHGGIDGDVGKILSTVQAHRAGGGPPLAVADGRPTRRALAATLEDTLSDDMPVDGSSSRRQSAASAAVAAAGGAAASSSAVAVHGGAEAGQSPSPAAPPQPLVTSSIPITITLARGRRFASDSPWVFFVLRVIEGSRPHNHPRTLSTSTKGPGGARSPRGDRPAVLYGFEALVAPSANSAGDEDSPIPVSAGQAASPFFALEKNSNRPYVSFVVDAAKQKRSTVSLIANLRMEFVYCKAEAEAAASFVSSRETTPPAERQETAASVPLTNGHVRSSSLRISPTGPASTAARRAGCSSYVMSWKAFPERPMRLTFLSIDLDSGGGRPRRHVWLPVLECLVDDVLCVLTSADVTMDSATREVIGVELHGISIEDVSRGSSQLTSSASSRRSDDSKGSATHPPRVSSTKTIGQSLSEVVVMSNVHSGEDD